MKFSIVYWQVSTKSKSSPLGIGVNTSLATANCYSILLSLTDITTVNRSITSPSRSKPAREVKHSLLARHFSKAQNLLLTSTSENIRITIAFIWWSSKNKVWAFCLFVFYISAMITAKLLIGNRSRNTKMFHLDFVTFHLLISQAAKISFSPNATYIFSLHDKNV